jgi:hypothetical protein
MLVIASGVFIKVSTEIVKSSNPRTIHLILFFINFPPYNGMINHQKYIPFEFSEANCT